MGILRSFGMATLIVIAMMVVLLAPTVGNGSVLQVMVQHPAWAVAIAVAFFAYAGWELSRRATNLPMRLFMFVAGSAGSAALLFVAFWLIFVVIAGGS